MELRNVLKILDTFGIYAEEFSVSDTKIQGTGSHPESTLDGVDAVVLKINRTPAAWQVFPDKLSRISYIQYYTVDHVDPDWVKDIGEAVDAGTKYFSGSNRKDIREKKNKYVMSILNDMTKKKSLEKLSHDVVSKKYSMIIAPKK